jgi:hypothetical protein
MLVHLDKGSSMAIVVVQSSSLSAEQKRRIGDRILGALHQEGIPAAASVVLFKTEDTDVYMDGGLLHEAAAPEPRPEPARSQPEPAEPQPAPLQFLQAPATRAKGRRSKPELADLKEKLVAALQAEGALSSFEAQARLGLKDDDGAPATLRRFFSELEEAGLIGKQGQKRGTRYVWKGMVQAASPAAPPVKLVKKNEDPTA